jgi:two-component sensor histidine kinase
MALYKAIPLITALALSLVSYSYAVEDDRYDDHPPAERFKIRIGGFLIDRFDTTARFDSTQYPIGTLIDVEEDFNVGANETVLRIDGFYRFNKRHRLNWTYYRSRRNGTSVAEKEYVIGDPDDPEGGFIIPKDSRVTTQWNYDLLKVGYAWSFLNKRRYEMFIGAGLNIRNLDKESTNAAFVEQSIADADQLLTTFGALLRIARIEAGGVRANFDTVDLAALVQDAAELYNAVAEEKQIEINVQLEARPQVQGDRDLLFQAIINLLDNAIKYSPQAGHIQLTLSMRDRQPLLSIADNGPGIPVEEHDKVMERFYRMDQSRSQHGSGLGLSLVAAVAQTQNASLKFNDNHPGVIAELLLNSSD